MRTGVAIAVGLVAATAEGAQPVLPPEAAAVMQAALDAVHADPRCTAWHSWTEIELHADRAVVRPAHGPGRATLVYQAARPWLRLDVDRCDSAPVAANAAECFDRALRATVTRSVWRDPAPTRDTLSRVPVAPRMRSPTVVWAWLAMAAIATAALGTAALRRLLRSQTPP